VALCIQVDRYHVSEAPTAFFMAQKDGILRNHQPHTLIALHKNPPLAPASSQINPTDTLISCFFKLWLILFFHLRLDLRNSVFFTDFVTKMLRAFLIFYMCTVKNRLVTELVVLFQISSLSTHLSHVCHLRTKFLKKRFATSATRLVIDHLSRSVTLGITCCFKRETLLKWIIFW
jgi:hypothetical protein